MAPWFLHNIYIEVKLVSKITGAEYEIKKETIYNVIRCFGIRSY